MPPRPRPGQSPDPRPPRLLDQVRDACRVRHFSPRTEEAYTHWIRRFIVFHHKQHPANLGAADVAAFLTDLATRRQVSASTQNQALSALLFLYRTVVQRDLQPLPPIVHATTPVRLPVVLSRGEVRALLAALSGPARLVVSLLYGSGLRLLECLELRVKDIDFDQHQITVRQGKGRKDRRTLLPASLRQPLIDHLKTVRTTHDTDLGNGLGRVAMPEALRSKYPNADRSWSWQFVFPAARVCRDPRWGGPTRFHVHESVIQKAVVSAVKSSGIAKRASAHTFRSVSTWYPPFKDCRISTAIGLVQGSRA